jgi:Bacterial PH domain
VTKSEPNEPRLYYQPIARAYMRGYAVLGLIAGIALAAGPGIPVGFRLLIAIGVFAYVCAGWRLGGRGLEARSDGIRFRRWFRWHSIPWPEIKNFCIKRPGGLSPTVYVDLVSGDSRVVPFTQGRQTRWKNGKSRDTVAVLNAELEQAQKRGTVLATMG